MEPQPESTTDLSENPSDENLDAYMDRLDQKVLSNLNEAGAKDRHDRFADQVVRQMIEGSKKALEERRERLKGTPFELEG